MKTTFLILIISTSLSLLAQNCIQTEPSSCYFYSECLEKHISCGENGYALGYGKRYCEKFQHIAAKLSEEGQLFIESTRRCLQSALVAYLFLEKITPQTCQEIREFAFDSHPDCYTNHEHSICNLNPLTDLRIIFSQYEKKDLIKKETIKEMQIVAKRCAQKFSPVSHESVTNSMHEQLWLEFQERLEGLSAP